LYKVIELFEFKALKNKNSLSKVLYYNVMRKGCKSILQNTHLLINLLKDLSKHQCYDF